MEKLPVNTTEKYDFMVSSVRQLGDRALQLIKGDVQTYIKPDKTKVTNIDIALNKQFIDMVAARYPRDLVWGEEESNSEKGDTALANEQWMWTIDPIDGTNGLCRSLQTKRFEDNNSAILLAGFAPGQTAPTIGALYNPFQERQVMLSAHPGGAFYQTSTMLRPCSVYVEDAPKKLEDVRRYEQSMWRDALPDLTNIADTMPEARWVRHQLFMGAVALGDSDISVFPGPSNPHDVAPGALVVHQAGGTVRSLAGEAYEDIDWRVPVKGVVAAANPELASEMLDHVRYPATV